jgi:hypothetical protein
MSKNLLKEIMDNESRPIKEDGLFPLDIFKKGERKDATDCNDSEHNPPKHYNIPQGFGYRHVCPACGKSQIIIPPQITL